MPIVNTVEDPEAAIQRLQRLESCPDWRLERSYYTRNWTDTHAEGFVSDDGSRRHLHVENVSKTLLGIRIGVIDLSLYQSYSVSS